DVVEPSRQPMDLNAEPVKSSLRVRLLGTLLSGVKEWCFASVQDVVTQKASTLMVGEAIQGATILEVERDRVIVLNNGRREFINNEAGAGEVGGGFAAVPPTPGKPDAPAPVAMGSG